jgi:hypothetical protein
MTGPQRRTFEAEMTLQYCGGTPLLATTLFGGGCQTVTLSLAERRTVLMCLGAQAAFSGRKRWEELICYTPHNTISHHGLFSTYHCAHGGLLIGG